jgi:hypothetical protein
MSEADEVALPPGVTVTEERAAPPQDGPFRAQASRRGHAGDGRLVVARRWSRQWALFAFALAWNAALVPLAAELFATARALPLGPQWLLLPLLHLGAGTLLGLWVVASFLNRTIVSAGADALVVQHRPIRWRSDRSIPVEDVERVWAETDGDVCWVSARARGRKVRLVALDEARQAALLANKLATRLGLARA